MKTVFEHIVKDRDLKYKHAKGMRDIVGNEFHQYHELLLFKGGQARFISETEQCELNPGCLVVIPKNTFHRFYVAGAEADYERCVFNFYETDELSGLILQAMTSVAVIPALSPFLTEAIDRLSDPKYSKAEQLYSARAVLVLLLTELVHMFPAVPELHSDFSTITLRCMEYIGDHIFEKISIEDIVEHVGYSASSVTHAFKKDMRVPIYTYILGKKLSAADTAIRSGVSATRASEMYGFSDYSCFFRLYKKKYGVSPGVRDTGWK